MKAVCIEDVDGVAELFVRDVEKPVPRDGELLVRVHCAGVNFADLYRAARHFGNGGETTAAIAGLEMAGEVVGLGGGVSGFAIGDRVMGLAAATYAEYCCIQHRLAMPVPEGMSWVDAAATSATFCTAHDALVTNAETAPGETVLVQAASSGVGMAAIQIANLLGAGRVMGTSTSPAKLARLAELGLEHGIDSKAVDFADAVLSQTAGHGADVIIENIGGETLPGDIRCAAVRSRIVNVGRLGRWTGEINLDEHSRKRIRLIGVSFRSRSVDEHAELVRRASEFLLPAFSRGQLRPVVDRVFTLDAAAQAQDYMKSGRHFGKLVLSVA